MEDIGIRTETDAMVSDVSCGLVRDDSGPTVENDPVAIMSRAEAGVGAPCV